MYNMSRQLLENENLLKVMEWGV